MTMSATTAMEVNAEARRILAVSISKLYASRTQRGGLRLHRSLLLSMVMRSARDIYHSSREIEEPSGAQPTPEEPMDTGSNPGEQSGLPEAQPELQPVLSSAEPPPEEPDSGEEDCDGETTEDKENLSPAKQSRKRRGKASAAPDFLPSKRARLEPGEERWERSDSQLLVNLQGRSDPEELTYIRRSRDKGITGSTVPALRSVGVCLPAGKAPAEVNKQGRRRN